MNEDRLIGWLRRAEPHSLIGDDAAVLPESDRWAITMDTQIAGVHFPPELDPAIIARRAVAVNLSDLAAMGASPAYAFLALAAPSGFDHRRFFAGLLSAARKHGLELAGGDLARSSAITAVLTLLGGRDAGHRWLRRDTALVGEDLWLGGAIGDAAAGCRLLGRGARLAGRKVLLPVEFEAPERVAAAARRAVRRQLLPRPQLELGRWLGSLKAGAAIDVSDGLARDLHRMCAASGVGAEVDLRRLPLKRDFKRLACRLGCDWRQLALGGGEDYVLLFTLPPGIAPPAHFDCTRIGQIQAGRDHQEPGVFLLQDGKREPLPDLGWDHLETPETAGLVSIEAKKKDPA